MAQRVSDDFFKHADIFDRLDAGDRDNRVPAVEHGLDVGTPWVPQVPGYSKHIINLVTH